MDVRGLSFIRFGADLILTHGMLNYRTAGKVWMPAKLLSRAIVLLIRCYQLAFSGFSHGCCRYHPTCSEYACQVLTNYGPIQGTYLSIKRLLSCHPWGGGNRVKEKITPDL